MRDESIHTESAWWRVIGRDEATASHPGALRASLRDEHWGYFEGNVLPHMSWMMRTTFPHDVAETLRNRLANSSRFRASELLYALLADLGMPTANSSVWACAAVEFLVLSRLTQDDIVDQHDYRWGVPTLRMLYGEDRAALVATELQSLAALCADEMGLPGSWDGKRGTSSPSGPALMSEYARRMASSMLRELLFHDASISEREYYEISTSKHCNGSLCVRLCEGISGQLGAPAISSLSRAVLATDMAAAIANDVAETDQRRGLDAVRFPQGEKRGDKTEFQLGRPSIFHVFMASDERVRNQTGSEVDMESISLRDLSPSDLFAKLSSLGAIEYARGKRDTCISDALSLLPPGFPKTAEWIRSAARLNV